MQPRTSPGNVAQAFAHVHPVLPVKWAAPGKETQKEWSHHAKILESQQMKSNESIRHGSARSAHGAHVRSRPTQGRLDACHPLTCRPVSTLTICPRVYQKASSRSTNMHFARSSPATPLPCLSAGRQITRSGKSARLMILLFKLYHPYTVCRKSAWFIKIDSKNIGPAICSLRMARHGTVPATYLTYSGKESGKNPGFMML